MNSSVLLVMISTLSIVTMLTGYFFYRVLTVPPKQEPDSYSEE